jgi:type VI protein secretion system component Hcp
MIKGYLDRIEDNQFAVILAEEIKKEFIIPVENLPEGSKEKSYFEITLENEKIISMKLDEQTTQTEQEKVDDLMTKLRSNSIGSKFKKN